MIKKPQKFVIMPDRSVHTLHPILQTIINSFLLILSAVIPPKIPKMEKEIVKANPDNIP